MAHGFLSYQNSIGESAIERRITKIVEDKLEDFGNKVVDSIQRRVNNLFQKKEVDLTTEGVVVSEIQNQLTQGQTPLLTGGNAPATPQSPLQRMLADSALAKTASPGAIAANPSVMGGPLANAGFGGRPLRPEGFVGDRIVDISATSLGVERDFGGDDMFVKRLNTIEDGVGGGSGEVVQAIDRLTFVTMSLVAATKEQTNQQMMIAAQQEQTSEKLARQAKAAAEENALERGGDFSGNLAYEKSAQALGLGGSGGGGGGGMFGAKALLGKAGRRGAERGLTRLGAGVGGKLAGKAGMKTGAKLGAKFGATTAGKMIGKKIPGLGLALGTGLAIQRMKEGKPIQALLEFASGAASTFPGIGTAVSLGLDGVIAGRDMGLIPFAEGGIVDKPTLGLLGENPKGRREGVFPLEGPQGRKTFRMFGEGILEAQKRNKRENSRLLAAGLSEYYDKQNGWEKFIEFLKELLPGWLRGGDPKDPNNSRGNRRGRGGGGGGINAADIDADSPEAKALIATIREVEGTAHEKGYDTWFGGRKDMKMTDMTLQEVYDEQTRRLNSGQATYNGLTSAAVGVGQFMNPLLQARQMYEARGEAFDPTKIKFDEKLQNDLLLDLAARKRGIDPSKKLTLDDFEILQKEWAGLGTFYGQTKRTTSDSLRIYEENLREATKNQPTPTPTPEPADRRQTDASQKISKNFGKKSGQSISFRHNGEAYHAVKTTNGWDIYKGAGGIFGDEYMVQTSDGKNSDVVDSFIKQAESQSKPPVPETNQKLSSATLDPSNGINAKSQEEKIVAMANTGGTTIINNTYVTGGSSQGGGSGSPVAPGPTKEQLGINNLFEMVIG